MLESAVHKKALICKKEKTQTLIIELDSNSKARQLSSLLSLDFVNKVPSVRKTKALIAALKEDENLKTSIVKRKNKTIAKYL